MTVASDAELLRKLLLTGEYNQLEEAFGRVGDDKLSIFEIKHDDGTFGNILKYINDQGKSSSSEDSAANMLSKIAGISGGYKSQNGGQLKIVQIWFARSGPPLQQPKDLNLQLGRMVKNEEVYIIPDGKEFQIFINGEIDKDRWGLKNLPAPNPPAQKYTVADLFQVPFDKDDKDTDIKPNSNGLRKQLGLESIDKSNDIKKSGFMFSMNSNVDDQKDTFAKLLEMANDAGAEGSLEMELLARRCTPIRFAMGIQNNLQFDLNKVTEADTPKGLITDIGIIEYRMHGEGELGCNLIPIGYTANAGSPSKVGQESTINAADIEGRIHKNIIKLNRPGIRTAGDLLPAVKNTVIAVAKLNARKDQTNPEMGDNLYHALMPQAFLVTNEEFYVGSNVQGIHRQKNPSGQEDFSKGSEIDRVRIVERQNGNTSYYEAEFDVRTENGVGKIRMRNEGSLNYAEFRKMIDDETKMTGNKELGRLMSRSVKKVWMFDEITQGVNVRIHHSVAKPEDVRSSLNRMSTAEGVESFNGSFLLYNNEMDFVRVNLDSSPTGLVNPYERRIFKHHFESNTRLANQPNQKKGESYISYQQMHSDPAMAVFDGFGAFAENSCDGQGNRKGGSNKGGYARRHMFAADPSALGNRMMNAVNEGLELNAENATFQLSILGMNDKGLNYNNINVKNSIVELIYVGVANPNRPKPEYFQAFCGAFCDANKVRTGLTAPERKGNNVDITIEAAIDNLTFSNLKIANLDFKTGKTGGALRNTVISGCSIDKLRIGHGGALNACTGLNVTGCDIIELSVQLTGGAGFDSSNKLYGNTIKDISLGASTISCDLRGTSFSSLEFKGINVLNRKANWSELERVLPLMSGFRYSYNLWTPEDGATPEQLRMRRNMQRIRDPFGSWWEEHFDLKKEFQWSNVNRARLERSTNDLHKHTARRDEHDGSKFNFGLNERTNDYGLKLNITQDDNSKAFRFGMFGKGPRPDRVYIGIEDAPNGWFPQGRPAGFPVNADVVLKDLAALGGIMRRYEEQKEAANGLASQPARNAALQKAEREARPTVEAMLTGWNIHGYQPMYLAS